jgi:Transposase DDE domain group 1
MPLCQGDTVPFDRKAGWPQGEANPRFVVTSPRRDACKAKFLYEKVYCARGDIENRIKECLLDRYADRVGGSTALRLAAAARPPPA